MKPKLTFLLLLTFLFLFSGSVYGDDYQDGLDAYERKEYKEALKWYRLAEKQGQVEAQYNLGVMYFQRTRSSTRIQRSTQVVSTCCSTRICKRTIQLRTDVFRRTRSSTR